jgi:MATE family multidrug resistance protein
VLTKPSYTEILSFAIPLMLGLMTMALVTVIDTIFIGMLGTAQLAAIPLAASMYIIAWIFFVGIMQSSVAFIAKAFGAKKFQQIGVILVHYKIIALFGLPLLLIYVQAWSIFANLAQLEAEVNNYAWLYLSIRVWDAAFSLLLVLFYIFYQSIGNSIIPMIVSILVLVLNVILDYGLIFGNFGMPALGVEGSAYATVLAQMIGAIVIISYSFLTQKNSFNLKVFHPLQLNLFKKILQIGLPQGIGDSIELIAWAIFSIMVAQLGTIALAANNIGLQVVQLLYLPGLAIGMASASYMGRFLGAKRADIAKITTLRSLHLGSLYMGSLGILLWFLGETIARYFTTDEMVIQQAILMFKVMAFYQIFDAIAIILRTTLSGAGDTLKPALLLFISAIIIMLPAVNLLSNWITPGLVGAWLGVLIYIIVLALLLSYYSRYKTTIL